MITRIELTNFMSHQHTVIEPAAGLTVLVGPNNCGKSAVVSALQILCSNDKSKHVMRHGEKECSVKVETDDGHAITWRRKESPSYLIDGTEFSRLGQSGLPDELHQVLRLPKVDAGSGAFDIHFGLQKEPIFLLGDTSAQAAKFFASSSDAIHLVEMQKRHKDKLESAKREKNRLEAVSKQLTAELEALEPAVDLDARCEQVEELYTLIVSLLNGIENAQSLAEQWEQRSFTAWLHRQELELLASLAAPPVLADADSLTDLIERLAGAERSYACASAQAAALEDVLEPPRQHDLQSLDRLIIRLIASQDDQWLSSSRLTCLDRLLPCPELADTDAIAGAIAQLETATSEISLGQSRNEILHTLVLPPQLDDTAVLRDLEQRLLKATSHCDLETRVVDLLVPVVSPPTPEETKSLEDSIARMQQAQRCVDNVYRAFQSAEAELKIAEDAIRRFSAESACPTCGSPLDAERLMATVMASGAPCHG